MSARPFRIFCAGQEITTYTTAHLERKKEDLTGSLSFAIAYTGAPTTVLLAIIAAGAEIQVYIGNNLAFTGTVDKRQGKKDTRVNRAGAGRATAIGRGDATHGGAVTSKAAKESYTITVRARGKTKRLVDSSQDHPTSTILNPTTRSAVETLVKSWRTTIEWLAPDYELDKIRLRDGATVQDELHRIANENGLYTYETRDGKLRYCIGPVGMGQALIAGDGILDFLTEQSEDQQNSEITVKGQRTKKGTWGKEAVLRKKTLKSQGVRDYAPLILQHNGDGSDDALERRAKFEADNREAQSKKVTVEVFHVQPKDGGSWDLGQAHFVMIPSEAVCDVMECVGLEYTVDKENVLKTTLHLTAVPSGSLGGVSGGGLIGMAAGLLGGGAGILGASLGVLGAVAGLGASIPGGLVGPGGFASLIAMATQQRGLLGITLTPGQYPASWGGADLVDLPDNAAPEDTALGIAEPPAATPPLTIED